MSNFLRQNLHKLGCIILIICVSFSGCRNVSTPESPPETNNAEDTDAYAKLANYIIEQGDFFGDSYPCFVVSKSAGICIQIIYSPEDNSFRLLHTYTRDGQSFGCWLVIADDNSVTAEIGGLQTAEYYTAELVGTIPKNKISIWEPIQVTKSDFGSDLTDTMMKYTRRSIVESIEYFEYFLLENNIGKISDFGIKYEKIQTTTC